MYTVLASSSARWRTGHWAEAGLACTVPAASPSAELFVQPETDLQRDLEEAAAVVLDPAAHVGDLEPVEVVQRFGGAGDRAPDRVVDALRGRADDLADGVDVVCHW